MRKRASDFNPALLAVIGLASIIVVTALALNLNKLPFFSHSKTYQADFPNAAGLVSSDIVTVDGVRVGSISSLKLHGSYVLVTFTVNSNIRLGEQTTAAAKVQTPLGTEFLEVAPAGPGRLRHPIPLNNVTVPYTLVGDLSQLTQQIENYNIPQLVKALQTSSSTFAGTPSAVVASALGGLARFSAILGSHSAQLNTIVVQGNQLATVLNQRSADLISLVGQGNLVLQVLQQRQAEIKQLLDGTAALGAEIHSWLGTDHASLNALLSNLQNVSGALANDSASLARGISLLAAFSRYAANITGSGPFADASVPTLLIPDNLLAQCSNPVTDFPAHSNPPQNAKVGCRP